MRSLYYVCDAWQHECDFVVARTDKEARRIFSDMYGGLSGYADRVGAAEDFAESVWLGPDAPELAKLGGVRLASLDFPRWQFGARVYGCEIPPAERYRMR